MSKANTDRQIVMNEFKKFKPMYITDVYHHMPSYLFYFTFHPFLCNDSTANQHSRVFKLKLSAYQEIC